MALTKIGSGGIENVTNAANATFLTIDASEQITVASDGGAVTTSLQKGLAKAWVNFDGSGPTVIRDSLGISAIADLGTGYSRLTFVSSFSNNDYSATGSAVRVSGDQSSIVMPRSLATATVEVDSWLENAGNGSRTFDLGTIGFNIHGDLA